MPVVISLQRDDDFYVGNERFVLSQIVSATEFKLCRTSDNISLDISDKSATEIVTGVTASGGGRQQPNPSTVRIAITAPADVLVLRGQRRRKPLSSSVPPRSR
jgi:hypothetical protein